MPARRPRAPLTPASERRLSLRAHTLLDNVARRSYLDKHVVTTAAGLLLRVAEHTGETAQALMTRLRINAAQRYLIVRCGQQLECARGDHPPPVIKRFLEVNKTKPSCVRGRACTCTQAGQRTRCGNYRRGDPAAHDFAPRGAPWMGGDDAKTTPQ